jgi:hypothetical protein
VRERVWSLLRFDDWFWIWVGWSRLLRSIRRTLRFSSSGYRFLNFLIQFLPMAERPWGVDEMGVSMLYWVTN